MTSIRRQVQAKDAAALHQEAAQKWSHLLKIRGTVAPLHTELPPELSQQLALWLEVMDAIEATAHFHGAVLAPDDSVMMTNWVNQICSHALKESLDAADTTLPPNVTLH